MMRMLVFWTGTLASLTVDLMLRGKSYEIRLETQVFVVESRYFERIIGELTAFLS